MKRVLICMVATMTVGGIGASCRAPSNNNRLQDIVRITTAKEFSCAEEKVAVKDLGETNGKHGYEASGCGATARFTFAPSPEPSPPKCRCIKHCPDENHPGGGTICCEWDCS
jgi:hypothetical protein